MKHPGPGREVFFSLLYLAFCTCMLMSCSSSSQLTRSGRPIPGGCDCETWDRKAKREYEALRKKEKKASAVKKTAWHFRLHGTGSHKQKKKKRLFGRLDRCPAW
jgi:hypothetical protein